MLRANPPKARLLKSRNFYYALSSKPLLWRCQVSQLHNLTSEEVSLAFQVLTLLEQQQSEIEVPEKLQSLSAEDWMRLEFLLETLLSEKKVLGVH